MARIHQIPRVAGRLLIRLPRALYLWIREYWLQLFQLDRLTNKEWDLTHVGPDEAPDKSRTHLRDDDQVSEVRVKILETGRRLNRIKRKRGVL
jgi:hypothetical protein